MEDTVALVVFVLCDWVGKELLAGRCASPDGVQGDGPERSELRELREPEATERAERKPVPLHGRATGGDSS